MKQPKSYRAAVKESGACRTTVVVAVWAMGFDDEEEEMIQCHSSSTAKRNVVHVANLVSVVVVVVVVVAGDHLEVRTDADRVEHETVVVVDVVVGVLLVGEVPFLAVVPSLCPFHGKRSLCLCLSHCLFLFRVPYLETLCPEIVAK